MNIKTNEINLFQIDESFVLRGMFDNPIKLSKSKLNLQIFISFSFYLKSGKRRGGGKCAIVIRENNCLIIWKPCSAAKKLTKLPLIGIKGKRRANIAH